MLFPDAPLNWKEVDLQKAVAKYLDALAHRGLLAWSHPPNEGKRHKRAGKNLKDQGMKAGEPDCIIYLRGGKTLFVELKTIKGSLKTTQKARHKVLQALGYDVHTVKAATPHDAVTKVSSILEQEGILA